MQFDRPYFFCGIGGSGMLPLALILKAKGARVSGSDRARDQGRTPAKFDYLRNEGIALFAQDGSGVSDPNAVVVCSAAVEDTIPDVAAAKRVGAKLMLRAELLSRLFNAAGTSIGVAGTSGKSTVTGMIGLILSATGRDPTVMNGAVMKNFAHADAPFASALVGKSDIFVSEVDESDGSIARYTPSIAVVNNISLDHKTMDELRALFRNFTRKAKIAVLNLDNEETTALGPTARGAITYSLHDPHADLVAEAIAPAPDGVSFDLISRGGAEIAEKAETPRAPRLRVNLKVPGRHNVSNALAALAAAQAAGVPLADATDALSRFTGVKRRLETIGTTKGITVIDDFAHNPDKIAATLATLHDFPGRLLIVFQPHGYGSLKTMKNEFIACFARNLRANDVLMMPDPVYYGGTTDKSVSSEDIVSGIRANGRQAEAFATRAQCGEHLLALAKPGDRIIVMGARDDTLSTFAGELLSRL